jgi:hypothetical protein
MLHSVALVRTAVSEELAPPSSGWQESASARNNVTVKSNRRTQRDGGITFLRNVGSYWSHTA